MSAVLAVDELLRRSLLGRSEAAYVFGYAGRPVVLQERDVEADVLVMGSP